MALSQILIIIMFFIIMVALSYYINAPKAVLPLTVIFIIFIISEAALFLKNNSNQVSELTNSMDDKNSGGMLGSTDNLNNNNEIIKPIPINLTEKSLKPKPLTFDPGKKSIKENIEFIENETSFEKIEKIDNKKDLLILEIEICKSIKNRKPVSAGRSFSAGVDSLFCYTKIRNSGVKQEIRQVWFYKNEVQSQIKYNIKTSNEYRSWTKKRISSSQKGNWKVDIQTSTGQSLGSINFDIN